MQVKHYARAISIANFYFLTKKINRKIIMNHLNVDSRIISLFLKRGIPFREGGEIAIQLEGLAKQYESTTMLNRFDFAPELSFI